jgi:hypothetical protein
MTKAKDLAQTMHWNRTGQPLPMSPALETVLALIDHYNSQHFYDRNRASERLDKLEGRDEKLTKGSNAG